ncbi:endonuclease III domain-containing protein [Salinibaculum rarum]|uniref:endonuclease III domain-containing protein n=1 Tax=Salinibaculum rarum TaxID=3058903 RepID=UPI00265E3474|nr:endonuclease III [Salinibaculum sp. KK48]
MPTELDAETRAEAVVDALGLLYHEDLDPDDFMLFPEGESATIETDDDAAYWQTADNTQHAFECLVRTILSQNTSDTASQPAHDALLERYDGAGGDLAAELAGADQATLAETIESAGLYNQKSEKIIGAAEWVRAEYGDGAAFDEFVKTGDPGEVRETLLSVDGVGPKTADCVLLFAGGRAGVFPVDTHVHRIGRRMGLAPADADHEAVREALEASVPGEKCGFGHTAMIQFGREYCSARKPACLDDPEACPLADLCDQVGVDTIDGRVVDPAETVGE